MGEHPTTSRCRAPFDGGAELCESCRLRQPPDGLRRCSRMVAESPAMRAVLASAAAMAASDAPIVLLGETGTGKEVLAHALHATSPRAGRPFVAVNCGALPAELMESELFGHLRGAFSGAVADKAGLFEEADGGTILLDEIGDLPLALQVKLLRVLQDGEVRRVGATRAAAVDVRVLAATHHELRALVEQGRFREDLYYRLQVFSLALPPLRARREDVMPLARQLLQLEGRPARAFSREAEAALLRHPWPGNVRELSNAVRHGAALARGELVELDHLPEPVRRPSAAPDRPPGSVRRSLAEVEREHLLAVLAACEGRQAEAARVLGIARNTLWRKLEAYRRAGTA
ncbi:MAG TPA: sigma-54 dependent transcriptional regulator [Anaeromyxobacteraceae bacterium]|nr:sigma-54 dependent transcriptional regulator [Anaeromyxobacteraceae bacterium]